MRGEPGVSDDMVTCSTSKGWSSW